MIPGTGGFARRPGILPCLPESEEMLPKCRARMGTVWPVGRARKRTSAGALAWTKSSRGFARWGATRDLALHHRSTNADVQTHCPGECDAPSAGRTDDLLGAPRSVGSRSGQDRYWDRSRLPENADSRLPSRCAIRRQRPRPTSIPRTPPVFQLPAVEHRRVTRSQVLFGTNRRARSVPGGPTAWIASTRNQMDRL